MNLVKPLLLAVLLVTGTFALFGQDADGQSGQAPHHLRVVWTEDPAHSAVISWSTSEPGGSSRVHFDTAARGGDTGGYAQVIEADAPGAYVDGGPYFHHARLTDLQPNTAYHFVVETDDEVSRELHFVTAPAEGTGFKLLYGGDSRSSAENRQRMNRRIASLHDTDPAIIALVHGGDYIDNANTWWQWSEWLEDHELTIGTDGRVLPIIPAKGNHEGRGVVYNRVFANPGGGAETNWFVTEIGDMTLINLDTEVSMAGAQRDWLEARLQEGRASRWLVVNYHRPAYPAVKSASGAKEHWVPLFEEYDVDLVCESDGHALKRTPPIRKDRVDYTGVTYVGEGGLGVPQRTPDLDRWYLQSPGMATAAHHVQILSIEPQLLRYGAILHEGTLLDELTIATREVRLEGRIAPAGGSARSLDRVEVVFTAPFDPQSVGDTGNWIIDPPLEVESVVPGDEVGAVLDLVNSASLEELDDLVGLDSRAAANIVVERERDAIDDWQELDAIGHVGPSALERLGAYALASADNPRNAVTLRVSAIDPETVYRVSVDGVTDVEGHTVVSGATVSFVYGGVDARADAINDAAGLGDDQDANAGCSVAGSGASLFPLFAFGLFLARARRRRV